MSHASNANTLPDSRWLVGLIQHDNFAASPDVARFQEFAARTQQHRYDIEVSPHPETPRTTLSGAEAQRDTRAQHAPNLAP